MPEDPNKKINLNLPQFKSKKNSRLFFMGERGNRHGGIHEETFMGARWTTDLPISDRVSFSPTVTAGKVNVDIPPIRHAHVPGEINKFRFPILGGGIKIKLGKKYGGDNISSNKAAKILDHGYIRNKPLTFKQRAFFGSKLNRAYGGLIKKYENGGDINTQIPLNIQPQDKLIKPKDIKMRGSSKYTIDSDYYYRNRKNAKIIKPVQNFLIQQGFLSEGDNDGFWGTQTEGALQDYITDQHISNFEWGENFTPSSDFLRKKVFTESGGYSDVKSSAGALGLMQFMPKNVKEFQKDGRYFDEVRTGWSASNNADAILGSQLYIRDLAENYGIITPNMNQKTKEAFLNIAYNWSPDGAMYLRDHLKTLTYPSGEKKGQKVDINDVNYWLPYIEKNRGFEGGWRYLKDKAGEPIYKKHWWTAEEIKAEKNPEKKKKMRGGWKWTKQYELDDKGEKIPASWYVPTETTNYARISHGMADPSNEKVTKKLSDLKDWNYELSDLIRNPIYKKEWGGYSQSHLSRLLEQGGDPGKTEPPENSYPELTGKNLESFNEITKWEPDEVKDILYKTWLNTGKPKLSTEGLFGMFPGSYNVYTNKIRAADTETLVEELKHAYQFRGDKRTGDQDNSLKSKIKSKLFHHGRGPFQLVGTLLGAPYQLSRVLGLNKNFRKNLYNPYKKTEGVEGIHDQFGAYGHAWGHGLESNVNRARNKAIYREIKEAQENEDWEKELNLKTRLYSLSNPIDSASFRLNSTPNLQERTDNSHLNPRKNWLEVDNFTTWDPENKEPLGIAKEMFEDSYENKLYNFLYNRNTIDDLNLYQDSKYWE